MKFLTNLSLISHCLRSCCWQCQTDNRDPAMNSTWSTFHLLLRCSRARAFSIDKWTSEIASWWARSLMCFMPSFTWVSSSLNNCNTMGESETSGGAERGRWTRQQWDKNRERENRWCTKILNTEKYQAQVERERSINIRLELSSDYTINRNQLNCDQI